MENNPVKLLAEMEMHFRGYENDDGYTSDLFRRVRESLNNAHQDLDEHKGPFDPSTGCQKSHRECEAPSICSSAQCCMGA